MGALMSSTNEATERVFLAPQRVEQPMFINLKAAEPVPVDAISYTEWSLVYNAISMGIACMFTCSIFVWLQLPNVAMKYRSALTISGLVTFIACSLLPNLRVVGGQLHRAQERGRQLHGGGDGGSVQRRLSVRRLAPDGSSPPDRADSRYGVERRGDEIAVLVAWNRVCRDGRTWLPR